MSSLLKLSSKTLSKKENSPLASPFSRLNEKDNDIVTVSTGCCYQNDIDVLSTKGQRCQMIQILFLTLIPIIILTGITLMGVLENTPNYAVKTVIKEGIYTSLDIGTIIHEIQKERGASVMYLSSNRDLLIFNTLLSAYETTDSAIADINIWPRSNNAPIYYRSKETFSERIHQYRDLVRNSNITRYEAIALYTALNAVAIDWIADVIDLVVSGHLSRSMFAYHMLLLAKDETGIERALGSTFYTKGNLSDSELMMYIEKKSVANLYTNLCITYSTLANSMINELYADTELSVIIADMRSEILGNVITPNSSLKWFANMTSYINILKDIQDTIGTNILSALQMELNADNTTFYMSIGLMTGAVILYPLILVVVFKLTQKIHRVVISLKAQTSLLRQERRKSEALLCEMLPISVAKKLMANQKVEPRMYHSATVFFSDVVGFTTICSACTPFEVVDFLNLLYNTFDSTLEEYDVYKVETIGDAYMVVSGIPEVNGDLHAKEISLMAMALLDASSKVVVPHVSQENIGVKVRVGIHTGPVVSGIVGIKMPRYCLFGDTVNVASRMESTGKPLKIQISEVTAEALKKYDCFQPKLRGMVEIKGKGEMVTYWLERPDSVNDCAEPRYPASISPQVIIQ
ncbi:uncharacterized protein LOC117316159 [Pecten maximus]|uniref:uncharacterized protein LOC117316159 n=1 Tax=Pecten maximus TaxID=6579 RepID=UPI001458AEBE|nr:uncharacterized protein LOC117316159 [Pecten maximus]